MSFMWKVAGLVGLGSLAVVVVALVVGFTLASCRGVLLFVLVSLFCVFVIFFTGFFVFFLCFLFCVFVDLFVFTFYDGGVVFVVLVYVVCVCVLFFIFVLFVVSFFVVVFIALLLFAECQTRSKRGKKRKKEGVVSVF